MKSSFKSAAQRVLKTFTEPMTAKEITEVALAQGYLNTDGATPEATMAAQLYVDIKKNSKTVFKKVSKGKFTLKGNDESASSGELIVEKQNNLVRSELRKQLHAMDPYQFELLIGELLEQLGYENVEVTKQSGDKGIDVIADLTLKGITDVKTVVQVKRYKESNSISSDTVTQLRGSAEVDQRGLIITLSNFTKHAIEEAQAPNKMPVSLVNGDKLLDLLLEHEVGVKKETLALYSIDSDWLDAFKEGDSPHVTTNKRRGIWPLPGGTENYVQSLIEVLDAIQQGTNSRAKLSKWFMKTYDNVNSESTAMAYAGVPRVLGLMDTSKGKLILTEAGTTFLNTRDLDFLLKTIGSNVFGVEEMLEFIVSSQSKVTTAQMLEFFNDTLDAGWKSNFQTQFRLNWLLSMGKIEKIGGAYQVKG